jgi:methyl-accepting chemotaxis protein
MQRSSDALDFAGNVRFREAMAGFVAEWPGIGSSGARKAYVDTNKYGTGVDGERLDFADGPEKYHAVHKQHHAYFRELASTKGYFDFLLIDLQGTIMYSISKGLEFGTNLRTGPYKSTGLAKAFSDATRNPDNVTEFMTEFEAYEPQNDALAQFRLIGVSRDGSVIGILALVAPLPLMVKLDKLGDAIDSYASVSVHGLCASLLGAFVSAMWL